MFRRVRTILPVCLLTTLLLAGPARGQAIIHVTTTGNDANDGRTWPTAKRTVQAGLNAAVAGDQVWVAAGTYVERITLKADVALYGGFAGTETDLSPRNWTMNRTVLDGNKAGSVVTSPAGATTTTRIDGFTIRNGYATYGGGIYCSSSSPTIANNTIAGNSSFYSGGGIYCSQSSPTIANNTITGNTAYTSNGAGSGIYCASYSAPTITNNIITANAAPGDMGLGGGIYCSSSSPTITNNTISGNTASYDGAGICCNVTATGYPLPPPPTIANNTITENIAAHCGGGIYYALRIRYPFSQAIVNNTITANSARYGGGIYWASYPSSSTSSLTIANTIVAFNSSGICKSGSGTMTLRYNCVYANTAYNYLGVTDPAGTDGNLAADPKLAGVAYGSLHIEPDSPCRDAGDDAMVRPGSLDIDGQPGVYGSHVDIGADESDGTAWPEGPNVIVRVSTDGDDSNDGASWATSKRTVQAAINLAASIGGDVWAKAGTYAERITLPAHVHVYGGFSGVETERSQRDWSIRATILDGTRGGSVVTALGGYQVCRIDGFTICNGAASYGGGIHCVHYSSPTIANNTITNNTADGGGGIHCAYDSSPTIINNMIKGNRASSGSGIYCSYSSAPAIANNTIAGNTAQADYGYYGDGGGIYCSQSSPTIADNTITGNSAYSGGGIYCSASSATITNNTITGNTVSGSYAYGGGIYCYCYYSSPTIANTIIAFNSSGVYTTGTGAPALRFNCAHGNVAYNYSGIADPTGINGNISADPLFIRNASPGPDGKWGTADDDYGDLRLQPPSPCINAGNNADLPPDAGDLDGDGDTTEPLPIDLGGGPRIAYRRVDMGAYEFLYTGPADFDRDTDVDLVDFLFFQACFAGPNGPVPTVAICEQADYDRDDDVDMDDFVAFVHCFNGPNRPPACSGP